MSRGSIPDTSTILERWLLLERFPPQPCEDSWIVIDREIADLIKTVDINGLDGAYC